MIIFRFKIVLCAAILALSGCGGESPAADPRISELQARVDQLERRLKENAEKDDRVFSVLKSEMVARRQKSPPPERDTAMSEFLDGIDKSKTERRLQELESREFLRSQGAER